MRLSGTEWRARGLRAVVGGALLLLGVCRAPYWINQRDADAWLHDDPVHHAQLARSVARWTEAGLSRNDYRTGSDQFAGEWLFGTYLMAGFGFGQSAVLHPESRAAHLANMAHCIDVLVSDPLRAFDTESWASDPLASLDGPDDHAAYLGYMNLLLSFHRLLVPDSRFADLNDRISAALARRMAHSPTRMLETYPAEAYPVDNCAVYASVALHARATGLNRDALLREWRESLARQAIDPESGLLIQAIDKVSGAAYDAPRGSGTTLGLYFLAFVEPQLSRQLYAAVRTQLYRTVFGFGGVRECPPHVGHAIRDIDSGPVVFGFGLSPTGFLLGGSRAHGDAEAFRHLYATAHAWGAPLRVNDRLTFVTGASLGDAILFAMLTALPVETLANLTPAVSAANAEGGAP